jgi:hypothetical protein
MNHRPRVPIENSIQRFSTQCNIVTFSSPISRGLTFIFFMSLISKPLPLDGIFGRDSIISVGQARSLAEMPDASTKQSAGVGRSSPLGATVLPRGVNFRIYSRSATGVELLFFDRDDDTHAPRAIRLDASTNRTFHYWHVFVPGLKSGQLYGYRVQGPFDSALGRRFDPAKVLLDPYGLGVVVPKELQP